MVPEVSICIPAYRQRELLKQALDSVIMQNFSDYEIIITDDTPGNQIEVLIKEYNNPKIRYDKNLVALGSPANWNKAIECASGEFIKILHHDDYFTSADSLGKFVKLLKDNPKADFAFSGTEIDLVQTGLKKKYFCSMQDFVKLKKSPELLLYKNYVGAPSATIIRRRALTAFDPELKWLVDIDWYIKLIRANSRIIYTKEPLICTVHGSEGQVTQEVQLLKEVQLKEHVLLLERIAEFSDIDKFAVQFQLLFHKFSVNSIVELEKIIPIPACIFSFIKKAIEHKDDAVLLNKIKYWSKKYTFGDLVYDIKRRLK